MKNAFLLVCVLSATIFTTPIMAGEASTLSKSISQFTTKFYNELAKEKPNENLVMSPFSAEVLIALLSLGSSGASHDEMLSALSLPSDEYTRNEFKSLATSLKDVKGVTLDIANKVYVKTGNYTLNPSFENDAREIFNADTEKLNFSEANAAAKTINTYVESKTNNRIKDLVSQDMFSEDTRMVLVNAIYFKGTWKTKFQELLTRPLPFHVDEKTTVQIPTMSISANFEYGESLELNAKLLKMPYVGDEAFMLIVLPNENSNLADLQRRMVEGADLNTAIDNMHRVKVDVKLPKFKIDTTIDLKRLLPKLGVSKIFNHQEAGLTKLLDNSEVLFVSDAVQKAFIEVNEEGAEAAAATAAVMMMRSAMINFSFDVNRPFYFELRKGEETFFNAFGAVAFSAFVEPEIVPFYADRPFQAYIITSSKNILFLSHFKGIV